MVPMVVGDSEDAVEIGGGDATGRGVVVSLGLE